MVLAGFLAACGQEEPEIPQHDAVAESGPVVVISIDTLRADRLPAYGYQGVATPAIDSLRRDGILYAHAYSHAPTTLPSHASLFTGQYPTQHGVRDNIGYTLAPEAVTLAERLQTAGYRTAGFISGYPLREDAGISQGFATWDDELEEASSEAGIGEIQRAGAQTVERARQWLREQPDGDFFLFVHLFEPHLPYSAPEPFASSYPSPYDAEVAYADSLVGELFEELEANSLYQNATVVLLADHGEGLGDHDEDDHGIFVYTSTLRVPLIVKLPAGARAGERIEAPAQLADVAPTLIALAGGKALPGAVGRDLLAPEVVATSIYAETYQPRIHFGWSELVTVIDYPYQYIEAPEAELYDLEADPHATVNLIAGHPAVVAKLRDEAQRQKALLEAPAEVPQATRDRLAALGYVTSGRDTAAATFADPKNRIHLLRHLKLAAATYFAGDYETAIEEYDTVLREDPMMPAAWEWMARSQQKAGHLAEALAAYEMLLQIGGGNVGTEQIVAGLNLQLGRYAAAAAAANRLLTTHPAAARLVLAQVAVAEGRYVEALRLGRRVLSDDGKQVRAHLVVAEALLQVGELRLATQHVDQATRSPALAAAAGLLRGRILMMGGETDTARLEFSRAVAAEPELLEGHAYLAATYFLVGDTAPGLAVLHEMVRSNPTVSAELRAIDTLQRFGMDPQAQQWREQAYRRHPGAGATGAFAGR